MSGVALKIRGSEGIALPVALMVLAIMLSLGLALAPLADNQTDQVSQQRKRETAFNVAESVLNAQIFQLSNYWPGRGAAGSPSLQYSTCMQAGGSRCPVPARIAKMIPSMDTASGIMWRSNVYDDSYALDGFYDDSRVRADQPGYDANENGRLWVRAEATVRGKRRAVIALVRQETQTEWVPHAGLIAARLNILNNGLHDGAIIEAGDTTQGYVAVRCTVAQNESTPCLGQPLGTAPTKTLEQWQELVSQQIFPFASQQGWSAAPTFTAEQLQRMLKTAETYGTIYNRCPTAAELTGDVVVIDTIGNCSYTGSDEFNSQTAPGMVILLNASSSLTLGGSTKFFGIIYHAFRSDPPRTPANPAVRTQGNTLITGGVIIDGAGVMEAGESGTNIRFDDHGYDSVRSLVSAGVIQNSWREIRPAG
jgi:hypothetical protein